MEGENEGSFKREMKVKSYFPGALGLYFFTKPKAHWIPWVGSGYGLLGVFIYSVIRHTDK